MPSIFLFHVHSLLPYSVPRLHAFPMFGIPHGDAMLFQARSARHAGVPTDAANWSILVVNHHFEVRTHISQAGAESQTHTHPRAVAGLAAKGEPPFGGAISLATLPVFRKRVIAPRSSQISPMCNYILCGPKLKSLNRLCSAVFLFECLSKSRSTIVE